MSNETATQPEEKTLTVPGNLAYERQGKQILLYDGALHAAHQQGLKSLTVKILQLPTPDNGMTCICEATAYFFSNDGDVGPFTDIADASPANVGSMVQESIIRMASTRAKHRALGDGINEAAVEIEGEVQAAQPQGNGGSRKVNTNGFNRMESGMSAEQAQKPMTENQAKAIAAICQKRGTQMPSTSDWTMGQASSWIQQNQGGK